MYTMHTWYFISVLTIPSMILQTYVISLPMRQVLNNFVVHYEQTFSIQCFFQGHIFQKWLQHLICDTKSKRKRKKKHVFNCVYLQCLPATNRGSFSCHPEYWTASIICRDVIFAVVMILTNLWILNPVN